MELLINNFSHYIYKTLKHLNFKYCYLAMFVKNTNMLITRMRLQLRRKVYFFIGMDNFKNVLFK